MVGFADRTRRPDQATASGVPAKYPRSTYKFPTAVLCGFGAKVSNMAPSLIKIKKGLDLPISGDPRQAIETDPTISRVAVVGPDYEGMRPTMAVQEGDEVKSGQVLFSDKKTPGVNYTSPGCGRVAEINRGAKRTLQSVVVELDGDEQVEFSSFAGVAPGQLTREQVRDLLLESGLWTALRTRPYSKVPSPEQIPHSIFVTAIDTNPLAADPAVMAAGHDGDITAGLAGLAKLTDGEVFFCKAPQSRLSADGVAGVQTVEFAGPHPAGLAGTHIHFLDPVGPEKTVWHLNYQDLIAFGRLFASGQLHVERVISLGGPSVRDPRLLKARLGASISELTKGDVEGDDIRVVSGGVFSGRAVSGDLNYLGRYHLQVTVMTEGREREFLGWQKPGYDKFSVKNIFASRLTPGNKIDFSTSTEGSKRAMVPVGSYEKIMPLDIIPTLFLRSLIVGDAERSQALGCLELDEEDLGLCTFVCPGKYEYAPMLRRTLRRIEVEG